MPPRHQDGLGSTEPRQLWDQHNPGGRPPAEARQPPDSAQVLLKQNSRVSKTLLGLPASPASTWPGRCWPCKPLSRRAHLWGELVSYGASQLLSLQGHNLPLTFPSATRPPSASFIQVRRPFAGLGSWEPSSSLALSLPMPT